MNFRYNEYLQEHVPLGSDDDVDLLHGDAPGLGP